MTTISPNRKRTAARLQIFSFVLLIAAVAGVATIARAPLANLFWRVGVPLSYLREGGVGGFSNFFSSFAANHALVVENEQLREAIATTSAALLDRDILYAENVDLKNRLGRIPASQSVVLASVLSRPPETPYDTLMIDTGRAQGVAVGDLVAVSGSTYIGQVTEVYATASRVSLFSAAGAKYNALLSVAGATSSLAIAVTGQGGGSLKAEVPAGTGVRTGDKVFFPSIMPGLIARVVYVEEKNDSSFKTIYMQLPVNIYTLRYVEVDRTPPTFHATQ